MFSRFKKDNAPARPAAPAAAAAAAPAPSAPRPAQAAPVSAMRAAPAAAARSPAEAVAADKEAKRKNRMMELKLELHKRLLETLNLSALEHASEQNLKMEISSLASEALDEMSVALNKDDRTTLVQELYDEVMGLGPLEPLLKDETVNDILVNGPNRVFVERAGKLQLTDVTFRDEGVHEWSLLLGWFAPQVLSPVDVAAAGDRDPGTAAPWWPITSLVAGGALVVAGSWPVRRLRVVVIPA